MNTLGLSMEPYIVLCGGQIQNNKVGYAKWQSVKVAPCIANLFLHPFRLLHAATKPRFFLNQSLFVGKLR